MLYFYVSTYNFTSIVLNLNDLIYLNNAVQVATTIRSSNNTIG